VGSTWQASVFATVRLQQRKAVARRSHVRFAPFATELYAPQRNAASCH
jgi:hypothetical protein